MAPANSNELLLAAGVLLVLFTGSADAWKLPLDLDEELPLIHMLRPREASGEHLGRRARVPCDSWRLGVETNNLQDWRTIPEYCERYVGNYMMGGQYRQDSRAVIDEAVAYAESLNLTGTGKEVWVFDVDETTLSNLPYYAKHGFGAEPYNWTAFAEYENQANAPALPESLRLYKRLQALGIKPVILTGRREDKKEGTVKNLARAGYTGYLKLIVKPQDARVKKLEEQGYIIVGNIGDQWTDILGAPEGQRTFKLPDPMYYVG